MNKELEEKINRVLDSLDSEASVTYSGDRFNVGKMAHEMYSAIWDFNQWIRDEMKYRDGDMSDEVCAKMEEVQEMWHDTLRDNAVDLYSL